MTLPCLLGVKLCSKRAISVSTDILMMAVFAVMVAASAAPEGIPLGSVVCGAYFYTLTEMQAL